jgi:hypothetical protein
MKCDFLLTQYQSTILSPFGYNKNYFSLGRAIAETMVYFSWTEYAILQTDDNIRRECYYIKQGLDVCYFCLQYPSLLRTLHTYTLSVSFDLESFIGH